MTIRDQLSEAGYLPNRPTGHAAHIIKSLDEAKCEVCGVPVGPECRGVTLCSDHLDYDIEEVGR